MAYAAFQFMNTITNKQMIPFWFEEQIHDSVPKKIDHKLSTSHT